MKIDINKKYTTTDGTPVEIFTTTAKGYYPVVGQIMDDGFDVTTWTEDGRFDILALVDSHNNLIEVSTWGSVFSEAIAKTHKVGDMVSWTTVRGYLTSNFEVPKRK